MRHLPPDCLSFATVFTYAQPGQSMQSKMFQELPRKLQQRLDRNKNLKLVYSYDDAQICVKK